MKFDVKISKSDLNKLKKDFNKLQRYSKEVATKEVYSTMLFATKYAKQSAPVDESFLRNSIFAEKTPDGAEMFSSANYAPYVEFGTGNKVNVQDAVDLGIPAAVIKNEFKGRGFVGKKAVNLGTKEKPNWKMITFPIHLTPKPFFYVSAKRAYKELITRVEKRLKRLT